MILASAVSTPSSRAGRWGFSSLASFALAALAAVAVLTASASASKAALTPTISALHRFTGADGLSPQSALLQASDGNLYGTTVGGGDDGTGCAQQCFGTVFKLTPEGQFTSLHTFAAPGTNGSTPLSGLVEGPDGYLYGTTYEGGTSNAGTVYKISPAGQFVKLHDFCMPPVCARDTDGRAPSAGLVVGRDGQLYGQTTRGGDTSDPDGTIFRISPSGAFSVVFAFKFTPMGSTTVGKLLLASDGNFYVTTTRFIFRITPSGQATSVYTFSISDGGVLELIQARDGNFYGVVPLFGSILRVSPNGTGFQRIHTLNETTEGLSPSTLVQASDGNLWGTTAHTGGVDHLGNVYTLSTDGTLLQSIPLRDADTGGVPVAPLIEGRDGKLYGTASTGGFSPRDVPVGGTVFVVDPSGGAAPPLAAAPTAPQPNQPALEPSQPAPLEHPAPAPVTVAPQTPVAIVQPLTVVGCSADHHEVQIDVEVTGTDNGVSAADLVQGEFQNVTSGMGDDEFRQASGYRTVSLTIGRRILADGQADADFSPDFDWRYAPNARFVFSGADC